MPENENRSLQDNFTQGSDYNRLEFIVRRIVQEMVNTSALVRVDGCTSSGSSAAAGTVSATPLVAQTDPEGNALPMASLPSLPHCRYQGGKAAVIIDPVPGDIGVAVFMKQDSSTVKPGTTEPQRPGSFRQFDMADGVLAASVSNQAPTVWIELKQDETIVIHAPQGVTIETDKDVQVNAGQNIQLKAEAGITLNAPQIALQGAVSATGRSGEATEANFTGTIAASDDVRASGISLNSHTHTGVQGGTASTGGPQ